MKNKVFKKLMLPILLCIGGFMYGQTVSGSVSDASGPLPGVSVNVKGTSVGTETDFDRKVFDYRCSRSCSGLQVLGVQNARE